MNKKILNSTAATTQKSSEQNKFKFKTLIANLGTATQLTLGPSGNKNEGKSRQIFIVSF